KPADFGEDTISLHVDTNDAYLCADVTLTSNNDNSQTEPEGLEDENDMTTGELAGLVNFLWWADDGDNVFEDDETIIDQGNFGQLGVGNSYPLTLADSDENIWTGVGGPVPGDETLYVGKAWCFGTMGTAPVAQDDGDNGRSPAGNNGGTAASGEPEDGGLTCDGRLLGNESQTDSLTADVTFEAVQARNNPGYQCEEPRPRTSLTLVKQVLDGDDLPSAWTLAADGVTDFSGAANSLAVTNIAVAPGAYNLSEINGPLGYVASNWNCVGGTQGDSDTVTIADGQNVTCTVVNYFTCEDPSVRYADNVITSAIGVRKDGGAIIANRTNPIKALGAPQSAGLPFDNPSPLSEFFSLGFNANVNATSGGSVVLEFTNNYVVDGPGNDLRMYEITGGTSYGVEKVKIEVSQNGISWFPVASSVDRDAEADLATSGLSWARYVRLTDVSVRADFPNDADGYDLDALSALTCGDRRLN
ncbi:MAG: hypothetical protein V4668_03110, partial [Patescibacteria group bacterium]